MNLNADLHVHTVFSCDSEAGMAEQCEAALAKGISCICFTDHADFNPKDMGYAYYDADAYFAAFGRAQEAYGDRLELLSGIEFGSPHIFQREYEQCLRLPYDFILCSVHDWYNGLFASEMAVHPMPIAESYRIYWEEAYRAVCYGGFDAMAHIDFPKRYYGQAVYDNALLSDIFMEMVKKDIALEINTSSLRKGLSEPMPGKELLDMYREHGGKIVTFGSDAHTPADIGAGKDVAERLAEGLTFVKYAQRKRKG